MEERTGRLWEVDAARGVAIILMVIFHLAYDLKSFYGWQLDLWNGVWFYIGRSAAVLFMLLAGLGCLFNTRALRHGLVVFGWGMVLTAATYVFDPSTYIRFGILHLIGVCIITGPVLSKLRTYWLVILAILSVFAGKMFLSLTVPYWHLIPFGLTPSNFISLDYYPLLPWYGVFLAGIMVGRVVYRKRMPHIKPVKRLDFLARAGRHSLMIYLLHQPILLAILRVVIPK